VVAAIICGRYEGAAHPNAFLLTYGYSITAFARFRRLPCRKAGGPRRCAKRAEIDPITEIPHLVGTILLIERIASGQPDAGRYRIRLVGSQLAAFAQRDMTGRWLDEAGLPPNGEWPFESLRTMYARTGLFAGFIDLPWKERSHVTIEWVSTRLASPPDGNDLIIFVFDKRPVTSDE
jgi:hypothetical protein